MSTSSKAYKLIIFDLDGTLTPSRESSAAPFERRLLPGVKEKCEELREQGAILAVATNQKQLFNNDKLMRQFAEIRLWLQDELGIFDLDWENGSRMKPHPSMIFNLVSLLGKLLSETLMVGDSTDDQEAAANAGVDFEWAKDFFGWEQDEEAN